MPIYTYAILVAGWLLWLTPFFRARQTEKPAKQVDRRARWGSDDHELITSGPYRFVRHPIYTSMLGVLLGTGSLVTPWWLFLPSLLLFIIGTEIRVRIEDHLLASQFGERFAEYQKRVPAYIPFPK